MGLAGVTRLELALPERQSGAFPNGYTPDSRFPKPMRFQAALLSDWRSFQTAVVHSNPQSTPGVPS